MKWAMFRKKTHYFSWNEQCSPKKHMTFHEMSSVHNKKTHDLHEMSNVHQKNTWPPWNEQCSPKKHMTFHEMSNVHKKNTRPSMKLSIFTKKQHMTFHEMSHVHKKTHYLLWNAQCPPKKKHIIFHEFAWNNQQNIERSAVLQVRGLMPFPQPLRWADGRWVLLVLIQWIFGGFCEIFVGMI